MNYRNPRFTDDGRIDCEIEHPVYGWIPFTASESDVEPMGREVFNSAKDTAEPYVAPPSPPEEVLTPKIKRERQASYQRESDPLFFKWQAGEGTKEDWLAKRAEINLRYPYPTGE